MCQLCAALHPDRAGSEWETHAEDAANPVKAAEKSDANAIANYLVRGFWDATAADWSPYNDPRKFDVQAGGTLTYSLNGLSAAEEKIARLALNAWTEVSGLKFREVNSGGDIRFQNDDPDGGAWSTSELGSTMGNGYREILYSVVNVESDWDSLPVSTNSYWFQTYVHEIGHALGLGHAGLYNGDSEIDREFRYDSWQMSVMSYIAQDENSNVDGEFAFLGSLMPADILAIQQIYGTNVRANHGDSIYGYGNNIGGPLGLMMQAWLDNRSVGLDIWQDNPMAFTVYDTGGVDVIDLSKAFGAQKINLAQGAVSDFMGIEGGMVIAYGTFIENVIGGLGNDALTGNNVKNRLEGRSGSDSLIGQRGDDILMGSTGNDRLYGGAGADVLFGGSEDDLLNGGSAFDTAVFSGTANIRISLGISGGQKTGLGQDKLVSIENLISGSGNDRLVGNLVGNVLKSGDGVDLLKGMAGADRLVGGDGRDSLYGGTDADTLLGGQGNGFLWGDGGNDVLVGGNLKDLLRGGLGGDRLQGQGGSDLLWGEEGADSLNGGDGADSLFGGAGNDQLTGGNGVDAFRFGQGQDRITDFQDDQDRIEFITALWGNAELTVAEVVSTYATVQGSDVVFDFGNGNLLTVQGITDTALLLNEIRIL